MTAFRLIIALLGFVLPVCLATTTARAGEFPDSYYFYEAKRPEALRKMEGKEPPALKLKNWIGEKQDLAKLKGKVVVVDFWATWCPPCMKSLPHNVALYKKHKDDGLMIIGVHDANKGYDKMAQVAKQQKINYPLAVDDGGASTKAWHIGFWPSYFVIDRKGIVRAAGLTPDSVDKVVAKLLKEEAPAAEGKEKDEGAKPKEPPAKPKDPPVTPKEPPVEPKEPPAKPNAPSANADSSVENVPAAWFERDPGKIKAIGDLLASGSPPEISSDTWINSEPLSLGALKGKVVLLDFWAIWCGPCIASIPHTNELMQKHGDDGLVIIGVCHPRRVEEMSAKATKHEIKYPVCADASGEIIKAYAVDSYPDYYLIDRQGRLRVADCNSKSLDAAIDMLLAEK